MKTWCMQVSQTCLEKQFLAINLGINWKGLVIIGPTMPVWDSMQRWLVHITFDLLQFYLHTCSALRYSSSLILLWCYVHRLHSNHLIRSCAKRGTQWHNTPWVLVTLGHGSHKYVRCCFTIAQHLCRHCFSRPLTLVPLWDIYWLIVMCKRKGNIGRQHWEVKKGFPWSSINCSVDVPTCCSCKGWAKVNAFSGCRKTVLKWVVLLSARVAHCLKKVSGLKHWSVDIDCKWRLYGSFAPWYNRVSIRSLRPQRDWLSGILTTE